MGSPTAEPFQGWDEFKIMSQGSRKLEPWAEICERLRRNL